jgi:glycosyltransferase 2 family protein
MKRKHLVGLAKAAFGIAMLAWIASGIELGALRALMSRGQPLHLVLGVGTLLIAMMYFQWSRLHLLIRGFSVSVATSLKIFYVGALFNNLLPSNIGGDAIRLVYLKNLKSDNWGTPFMLLLLYRVSGMFVLVLGGLVYIAIEHRRLRSLLAAQGLLVHVSETMLWVGLIALLSAAGVALLMLRKLSDRMRDQALGFLRNCRTGIAMLSPRDLVGLVTHTVLLHAFRMLSFYYLALYLGQYVSMWDLVFVVSATAVAAVLPITVAGLGIIEGSISGLLVMYGVDTSAGVAIALANRAVLLLLAAIGGVVYVTDQPRR